MRDTDVDPFDVLQAIADVERARIGTGQLDTALLDERSPEATPATSPPVTAPSRRRRRRRALVGAAVVSALCAGGITAGANRSGTRPPRVEAGVVCRAELRVDASASVIEASPDPIAACAELWAAGHLPTFPDRPEPGQPVPELVVCQGPGGAIEVYPGGPEGCAVLDLAPLSPEPDPYLEMLVEVHDRAIEMNMTGCLTAGELVVALEALIDEYELDGWTVHVENEETDSSCAKAGMDSWKEHLFVANLEMRDG